MSGTDYDNPDAAHLNGGGNGAAVSDEDLRDLLDREKAARARAERERDTERASRSQIERERDEARGSASTAVEQRWAAEEQSLDAGLAAAESEADALEQRIAQLYADGNFQEAAKVSRQQARVESTISLIGQKKQWLTDARAQFKVQQDQAATARTQPQQNGGVDLSNYSAKQRAWINDHPEYLTDKRFQARVAAGHNTAVADGIEIDSDEYFDTINSMVGGAGGGQRRAADDGGGEEQPARRVEPAPRRNEQGAVMPVTRTGTGRGSGQPRPGEVRLSPDQREAADFTMPEVPAADYQDDKGAWQPGRYRRYATNMQKLRSDGRLN